MMTVALRLLTLDGLADALSVQVPEPVPPVTLRVSHATLLLAAHPTPAPTVTVTTWVPPAPDAPQVVALSVTLDVPAACVTATVWPAMVTVALRLLVLDGLAAAVSVT
jgi:hypothetical protein